MLIWISKDEAKHWLEFITYCRLRDIDKYDCPLCLAIEAKLKPITEGLKEVNNGE